MSLIRLFAVALLLPIAACGDGDGYTPLAPAASLPGTWVRALDPAGDYSLIFVSVPPETLFIARDRSATWSQEVWLSETVRDRVRLPARLELDRGRVRLQAGCDDTILAMCALPRTVGGQEAPGTVTGRFELVRTGADWIRLDMPMVSSQPSRWYRRAD